jgi:phosphopantothenoylcysteine decarboxylase/phosphopantothenate--cysteine ligase
MRYLVTAGPTREYLDDVRFLSNASSGRMGCALAGAARAAGGRVTLVHGPSPASRPSATDASPSSPPPKCRGPCRSSPPGTT